MATDFRDLVSALDAAQKEGAAAAELMLEQTTGHSVQVHRSRVLRNTPVSSIRMVARAWLEGGRLGEAVATTGEPSAESWAKLFKKAIKAAAKTNHDPLSGPVGRLAGSPRGLGLEDRRYAGLTAEMRLDVVVDAERGARDFDRKVLTEPFNYDDRHVNRMFADSKGTTAEEAGTYYSCSGGVRVEGDGAKIAINGGIEGRSFASISSLPYGVQMARRAMELLGSGPTVEGPVRVLLQPLPMAQLLDRISAAFTYDALASGGNFLADVAVDDRIHLLDDGTLPGAYRSTSFDDRGVGPVPLTLIRDGVASGRFLDPRTARKLDTRPTGHESREGQRPRNLVMRPGTRSMNAVLSDLGGTVLAIDHFVDGFELDLKSGDFRAICYGDLRHGTESEGPVRAVVLSGNLLTAFKGLVELTSDTDRHGHIDAPGIIVDGFTATPGKSR